MVNKEQVRAVFRKFDFYAQAITFNYKQDSYYRTVAGGIFTFITVFFFVYFTISQLVDLSEGDYE